MSKLAGGLRKPCNEMTKFTFTFFVSYSSLSLFFHQLPATQPPEESSFRRKLSKREKRNMKKENKLRKMKSSADHPDDNAHANNGNLSGGGGGGGSNNNKGSVAEKLYTGKENREQTVKRNSPTKRKNLSSRCAPLSFCVKPRCTAGRSVISR